MLDAIRQFVHQHIVAPERGTPGGANGQGGPSGVELAACALLLEIAHADDTFDQSERDYITAVLQRHFGLEDAAAQDLIRLAEQARAEAVDDFQFTHTIAEQYDLGQRMVLAEVMWGLILADGKIAERETYLVRKLGSLLDLKPAYLAEARRAAAKRS
jgi:uncharacterized tellurite resistance protein B-like protein